MVDSATEFTAVSLGITQSLLLWTDLMPSLTEIKNGSHADMHLVSNMRHTEIVVSGIALLVGGVSSVILKSPLPVFATASTIVGLIAAYELTLAAPPVIETSEGTIY